MWWRTFWAILRLRIMSIMLLSEQQPGDGWRIPSREILQELHAPPMMRAAFELQRARVASERRPDVVGRTLTQPGRPTPEFRLQSEAAPRSCSTWPTSTWPTRQHELTGPVHAALR